MTPSRTAPALGDLFDGASPARETVPIADGAVLLRGFAADDAPALLAALEALAAQAPFRHMITPGGYRMSVAMTNGGAAGWITDRRGYRYEAIDPETQRAWPALPPVFLDLADRAAAAAGHPGFVPDACLINRYAAGSKLSLHQDRNERDYGAPIVSVSLGLPAVFLLGGPARSDPTRAIALAHGDVLVFGGPARLFHHGVKPLKAGDHPATGACRINLTFRKAG